MIPTLKTRILLRDGTMVECYEWRDTVMRKVLNGKCMVAGYELRGWIDVTLDHEDYPSGVIGNVQIASIAAVVPIECMPEDDDA